MRPGKVALTGILALIAGPCLASADELAKEWLLKSMTSARKVPTVAIVVRPVSPDGRFTSKVRIEQHSDGRVRHTVLEPEPMAGVVSVDDGKLWTTYIPKAKRLIVQESPRIEQGLPSYQVTIASFNYVLSLHRGPEVAKRRTLIVSAKPKAKELASRWFYLDRENGFLLRIDVSTPDGKRTRIHDTTEVDFGVSLSAATLKLGGKDVATVKTEAPRNVDSPSRAKRYVGFTPIAPRILPFGFIIKQTQVVGGKDARFIATRLTDGMAVATVYQWKDKDPKFGWPFNSPWFRESQGVRLAIVGDLPKAASDSLLDAFVRR